MNFDHKKLADEVIIKLSLLELRELQVYLEENYGILLIVETTTGKQ